MEYTLKNESLSLTVNDRGAEMRSLKTTDGTEYLWQGDSTFWQGTSPNLFPYVGRMTQKQYEIDGRRYSMEIHGFALRTGFEITEQTAGSIRFRLTENEQTLACYPRRFAFDVSYRLNGSTVEIGYTVENRDAKTMFFGIGGHPGFNVPLRKGERFGDYSLFFPKSDRLTEIVLTPQCFPDGTVRPFLKAADGVLPLTHDLFDNDAVILTDAGDTVSLFNQDGHGVTVCAPDMKYFGLWHAPKTEAPYVCIEPWRSLPSGQDTIAVFEEQEDLVSLESGKVYHNRWSITVRN